MPIVRNNRHVLARLLQAKLAAGLSFAVREGAEQYRNAVKAKTHDTFPTGPFKPPHSSPGEFPDRETGQGHDNIAWELRSDKKAAAFGVKGAARGEGPRKPTHSIAGGMHLIWLTGARGKRKGPKDVVNDHKVELADQFIEGARSIR